MSKAQIEFLQRCKALNLHSGSLNDWLDRIEELERKVASRDAEVAELVAALERLADYVDERSGDNECRPLENAKAALAKVKKP